MQMMNIRMKFSKGEEAKYISHLDLMRTFQRAMRRAKIPMMYSAGFNPHPEMSFAQALSLGVSSVGEYVDIKIKDNMDIRKIKDKLNDVLPAGLNVTDAVILKDKAKSAMALVTHSEYILSLCFNSKEFFDMKNVLSNFMNQTEIYVMKEQSKKDSRLIKIDIKPMIKSIDLMPEKELEGQVLNCILNCGSKANLKPELLIQAIEDFSGLKVLRRNIKRMELYMEIDQNLVPLLKIDNA